LPSKCYLLLALGIVAIGLVSCQPTSSAVAPARSDGVTGDPKHGEELFRKRCSSCHSLDKEKEGPMLRGVFGRKSASVPNFKYSDAMRAASIIWDGDSLDKWLTDTDRFIPDNDMNSTFKKADERADIIAYLQQLSHQ
jgi:cytochrome c